jgi:hypothetical protein
MAGRGVKCQEELVLASFGMGIFFEALVIPAKAGIHFTSH